MIQHKLISFDQKNSILLSQVSRLNGFIEVSFCIAKSENRIRLLKDFDFEKFFGGLQNLTLAEKHRADELWQSTCFEFFIATTKDESEPYFEFNLGKNLNWNFYHLDSYRNNLRADFSLAEIDLKMSSEEVKIRLRDLWTNQKLHMSVTAVLKKQTGDTEYHAVCHASDRPDFHSRKSFLIEI